MIIPFWWIAKYPPSKPYRPSSIIHLGCPNCTKEKADEFSKVYYNKVKHHPQGLVVDFISITELDSNPVDSVPEKFKKWMHIMSNKAAK
jgi:hypothetical protein